MQTFRFKTNINCGGCIKAVTPFMTNTTGIKSWEVDTTNPDKILTVAAEGLDAQAVQQVVEEAGFEAEVLAA